MRELENAMERAVILLQGDVITERELPLSITRSKYDHQSVNSVPQNDFNPKSLEEIEKNAILEALKTAGGNKSEAARLLKLNRRTLYSKMEKLGIT